MTDDDILVHPDDPDYTEPENQDQPDPEPDPEPAGEPTPEQRQAIIDEYVRNNPAPAAQAPVQAKPDGEPWQFNHLEPEKSLAEFGAMMQAQWQAQLDARDAVRSTLDSMISGYSPEAQAFVRKNAAGMTPEQLQNPDAKDVIESLAAGYEARKGIKRVAKSPAVEPNKPGGGSGLSPGIAKQLRDLEKSFGLPEGHITPEKAKAYGITEDM